ncbi:MULTISPECIES: hypothetical protein [Actinomycetes]|uniref:hypothetical protein n=1 Tax=Actinomycetes TaxID=1760 RepID=UPI00340436A8
MTETIPEAPAVPDLAQVLGAPAVTILVRAEEAQLGDIADSTGGLVRVREIVQRHHTWDLAGDPPGHVARVDRPGLWPGDTPPLIRHSLPRTDVIRVRRTVKAFGRLPGHSKNVHSHAPVKRGWYTDPGGYDAECSCGWKKDHVYVSKSGAAYGWLEHKASELTRAAHDDNSALAWLATTEAAHCLPPVPWTFKKITHGPRNGGGIAEASLDYLPLLLARQVLAAWRDVLTVDSDDTYENRREGPRQTSRGSRPGYTYLRLSGFAEGNARIILSARIDEPDDPE